MRREHDNDKAIVPFPTYPVSNMEWVPKGITEKQVLAERLIAEECADRAKRHGMTRAKFLRTAAATATAFMVLNKIHGSNAFAVKKEHCDDPEAASELLDKKYFVMDVQQHHVDLKRFNSPAYCFLRFIDRMSCPASPEDVGQMNYVKEIFVDSETDVGVISGLPFGGTPLGPGAMIDTRNLVNELAGASAHNPRCIAQAVCDPAPEFQTATTETAIAKMEGLVKQGTRALKCYTYSGNWRMDDEKVAYPMLTEAQRLGIRLVNVHKGLPAIFAPGSPKTVRALDLEKAVLDWPKMNFCAYHSAYFGKGDHVDDSGNPDGKDGLTEWLEVIDRVGKKDKKARKRLYSEIGSTFAIVLGQGPEATAHFIGTLLKALGSKNILWGTDSIWWGSPQFLIDAFKVLTIPDELQEKFGYPALTEKAKRRILGLNSARLYGVKPKGRCQLPESKLAVYQAEQGGFRADRRLVAHGPRTRREFFAMLRAEQRREVIF